MTTVTVPLKRVKRKLKRCQNPLFEKWLKEWKEEAAKSGSDMQYCFNKALKSLQKFPFRLDTGKECIVLENFGAKICQMLDKKLEEEKCKQPNSADTPAMLTEPTLHLNKSNIHTSKNHGKKRKSTEVLSGRKKMMELNCSNVEMVHSENANYMPTPGSGASAILIAMIEKSQEDNFKGYLTKTEIQSAAQAYCDSSFTIPKAGSYYTAWSSMNLLIKKNLVIKTGNPPKYNLSSSGEDLAIKLKTRTNMNSQLRTGDKLHQFVEQNKNSRNLVEGMCEDKNIGSDVDMEETIFMVPNSFKILLLVDNQERDNKFQQADQMTVKQLKLRNVDFEIRHLKVGDFIWIARNDEGQELVLPYVVERKRMDDLASSIKDGRFHEQKFRLKQSGLENLIYLVEKYGNESQRLGLPLPTLAQAISNTQIIGRFMVKLTNDHGHSMRYLDCMTKQLNNIFKNKTLMSSKKSNLTHFKLSDDVVSLMSFKDFNKGSEKNKKLTIRNMLVKHLLQLNGLSVEKAKAIVHLYPTPKLLMKALRESDGEKIISKLTYGGFNRSIGPVAAKQLHMLYTSTILQ